MLVTVIIAVRTHVAALQAQDDDRVLVDSDRGRGRPWQQPVVAFRQGLAEPARHFRDLGTRNRRRRQELAGKPRRQVQFHRSDRPARPVDIDRRFGVERDRPRDNELRSNAALAGLAPLHPPFA
jgi:hypothetical protein